VRSITRLHDDELSCLLPFLSLSDLAQLVRCARRFNAVARKERSRGLELEGGSNIVPLPSSALSHHIISLHLERRRHISAPRRRLTRDTLKQLRDLPALTALQLTLRNDAAVDHFMDGLSLDNAAAELRATLPTHLRSFSISAGTTSDPLRRRCAAFASSFWAALGELTQLTELCIKQHGGYMHPRPALAQLPHLRKLTLGPAGERGEHVEALKQLSHLRELILLDWNPGRIRLLAQPPHALQLKSLALPSMSVDEVSMRALLHLATLTALRPGRLSAKAWPLLPQLPLLRHLSFSSYDSLTPAQLSSLCAAFSHCPLLVDLTLAHVSFEAAEGGELTTEQKSAGWAALLSRVPNLRRLAVDGDHVAHLLPVLPLHVPLLAHLTLCTWAHLGLAHYAWVSHPNIRQLDLHYVSTVEISWPLAQAEEKERPGPAPVSLRLPNLERCVRHFGGMLE
jgi:hypothetical protein